MKTYLLPEEVHTAILAYLYGRPYKEVALGIKTMEALKELEEPRQGPQLAAVSEKTEG